MPMRRRLNNSGEDDVSIVFRDTISLALAAFMAVAVLLIPHVHPKAKAEAAKSSEPPGNVIVEVRWPDGMPADVDCWVRGPDGNVVGYSAKSGPLFNLLRDDLGTAGDIDSLNYETLYSRGILAGEYAVNLHFYRDYRQDKSAPVEVLVVLSVKVNPNESAQALAQATVMLPAQGVERTALRLRLTADGALVPGSVNRVFVPLRSA